MTFTYNAGTTTPTYAGLVEFNGVRLNDGTYKTQHVPPITDTAPVRSAVTDLGSDHGGYAGTPLLSAWAFDIEGWLYVPTGPDDVPAAINSMRSAWSLNTGLSTMVLNGRGWSQRRQMLVRLNGSIQVLPPTLTELKVPRRDFVIPLVAPDPLLYDADTLRAVTVTTSTTLTNAGSAPTPFVVRFNGPRTNPQIDGPGGSSNRIRYAGTITTGHWVEVGTNPVTGIYAVDDTGANVYGSISNRTATTLPVGVSSWTATSDSGSGTVTVSSRDAWA